jgi:hypothetical protein
MKFRLAVGVCALFALVPLAAPKGKPQPAALTLGGVCGPNNCVVTATGLAANTVYILEAIDSCGQTLLDSSVNSDGTGTLTAGFFTSACGSPISLSLFTFGKRSTLVTTGSI